MAQTTLSQAVPLTLEDRNSPDEHTMEEREHLKLALIDHCSWGPPRSAQQMQEDSIAVLNWPLLLSKTKPREAFVDDDEYETYKIGVETLQKSYALACKKYEHWARVHNNNIASEIREQKAQEHRDIQAQERKQAKQQGVPVGAYRKQKRQEEKEKKQEEKKKQKLEKRKKNIPPPPPPLN